MLQGKQCAQTPRYQHDPIVEVSWTCRRSIVGLVMFPTTVPRRPTRAPRWLHDDSWEQAFLLGGGFLLGLAGTVVQGTWSAIEYFSRTFVGTLCSRSSFTLSTPRSSVLDSVIGRPYPRFHLVVNRVLVRCL